MTLIVIALAILFGIGFLYSIIPAFLTALAFFAALLGGKFEGALFFIFIVPFSIFAICLTGLYFTSSYLLG